MSRKNNKKKDARHNAFYRKDEKERLEKLKRRNETRVRNLEIKAGVRPPLPSDLQKRKDIAKKEKVAPVVAAEANARKMQKMLNNMSLDQKENTRKGLRGGDSSDSENDMEVDERPQMMGRQTKPRIFKLKPKNREYYQ